MAHVTVTFGSQTHANGAITPSWIRSAVEALERAGQPLCGSAARLGRRHRRDPAPRLVPAAGRRRREAPNAAESDVIDRWRRLRLDQPRIVAGEIEAFVRQCLQL